MATTTPHSTPSRALPRAPLPQTMGAESVGCGSLAMSSASGGLHDPTLLVAALEEIEARRAAIEWLLAADLLCLCLV